MKKRNFTLIELLVVIAIITILAAILLPALNRSRDRARSISCLSNLKTMGNAYGFYGDDHKEVMPALFAKCPTENNWTWYCYIIPYIQSAYTKNDVASISLSDWKAKIKSDCPVGRSCTTNGFSYGQVALPSNTDGNIYWMRTKVASPCSTVQNADAYRSSDTAAYWDAAIFGSLIPNDLHGDSANILLVDGHAASIKKNRGATQCDDYCNETYIWLDKGAAI